MRQEINERFGKVRNRISVVAYKTNNFSGRPYFVQYRIKSFGFHIATQKSRSYIENEGI